MKTVNGAPQFEQAHIIAFYAQPPGGPTTVDFINEKIREWAESRRCVKCKFLTPEDAEDYAWCNSLNLGFGDANKNPEQFSCTAFEEKK